MTPVSIIIGLICAVATGLYFNEPQIAVVTAALAIVAFLMARVGASRANRKRASGSKEPLESLEGDFGPDTRNQRSRPRQPDSNRRPLGTREYSHHGTAVFPSVGGYGDSGGSSAGSSSGGSAGGSDGGGCGGGGM